MSDFDRQLGEQSGVQLNPLQDNSEIFALSKGDQNFGIMARLLRGRIDRPFAVNRGNILKKTGRGARLDVSALNEAWVHIYEAVNKGAYSAVIQRLITPNAVNKYIVCKVGTTSPTFTAETTIPTTPFIFAIKHLEAFNDGIIVRYRADSVVDGGTEIANSVVTLQLLDPSTKEVLHSFKGSLNSTDKDDYERSFFITDIVAGQTDEVEVTVGSVTSIATTSSAYGFNYNRLAKWATSSVVLYFTEGSLGYSVADYEKAKLLLESTDLEFEYLSTGGSMSPALISKMADLSYETNKQMRMDIHGSLTPEAAEIFLTQLNLYASITAHLIHVFWSPLKTTDPSGVNGICHIGTATLNIALACRRNANRNSKGFAPKNYVIAGKLWPVDRRNIKQVYLIEKYQLSFLAKAKINPVIWQVYSGGGRYVFFDSLTCAKVNSSLKKLISVADMSTHIDTVVTRYARGVLHLPMKICISKVRKFLKRLFDGAYAAGWIIPFDNNAEFFGSIYKFEVSKNEVNPYDTVDVKYWLQYDGTVRQVYVTQTLARQ